MRRWMPFVLAAVGLCLAGCEYLGMVGNPKTGFTVKFPAKWEVAGNVSPVPDFIQQAMRFQCQFDRCGRHATATGLYGRLPQDMRAVDRTLPGADDVAAMLDLVMQMRGQLRERHLRRSAVGPVTGYRMRLELPNRQGMDTVVHAAVVFHADRFLFFSVSAPIADDDSAERLLDEVADAVKVPSGAGG